MYTTLILEQSKIPPVLGGVREGGLTFKATLSLDATVMVSKKTAHSLVNTLLSFSWHNSLPEQRYEYQKHP